MLSKNILTVFAAILLPALSLFSQHEKDTWYFGKWVGISFKNDTAVSVYEHQMEVGGACVTISDKHGNLLFYSDGTAVWGRNHNLMPNGTGLTTLNSSRQFCLALKKPGSNLYYLFTGGNMVNAGGEFNIRGFYYSIIDMSLNGGLGDVVVKNGSKKSQISDEKFTDKLTAVKKSNGCGYWIITHPVSSNKFYSYSLNANGLDSIPVVSATGVTYTALEFFSELKASPDGKKLVTYSRAGTHLYDFDAATGKVSNEQILDIDAGIGLSFSPNSRYVYATRGWGYEILQYDITLPTLQDIWASRVQIVKKFSSSGSMQIGPDKKIYIARHPQNLPNNRHEGHIAVINNPDEKGLACNYVYSGFQIADTSGNSSGAHSMEGLPNFIDADNPFHELNLGPDIYYCRDSAFILQPVSPIAGRFLWSTGETTPAVIKNKPGAYWLRVEIECDGATVTLYDTIDVIAVRDTLPLYIGKDTVVCDKVFNITVPPKRGVSYEWSTGSRQYFTSVYNTHKLWLKTTSACGVKSDTLEVVFFKDTLPDVNLGKDTAWCGGFKILTAGSWPKVKYLWSTGDTTYIIKAVTTGNYWLRVSNYCYSKSDTISIGLIKLPPISLGDSIFFCDSSHVINHPLYLDTKYLWSTGDTTHYVKVFSAGKYWLRMSNSCGDMESDTIDIIKLNEIKNINIGSDTVICKNSDIVLNPGPLSKVKYLWSTGDTTQSVTVSNEGIYKLVVITVCNNSFSDSIAISHHPVIPLELPADTSFCRENFKGWPVQPAGPNNYTGYLWSDGNTTALNKITTEGPHILTVTDVCNNTLTDTFSLSLCHCVPYIPSAFTPNNDGLNDVLQIHTDCVPEKFTIKIYNRWGELLYHSDDLAGTWDGTYKNLPVTDGVYMYLVEAHYSGIRRGPSHRGTLTIIR